LRAIVPARWYTYAGIGGAAAAPTLATVGWKVSMTSAAPHRSPDAIAR